jgi:hypothetical protein
MKQAKTRGMLGEEMRKGNEARSAGIWRVQTRVRQKRKGESRLNGGGQSRTDESENPQEWLIDMSEQEQRKGV